MRTAVLAAVTGMVEAVVVVQQYRVIPFWISTQYRHILHSVTQPAIHIYFPFPTFAISSPSLLWYTFPLPSINVCVLEFWKYRWVCYAVIYRFLMFDVMRLFCCLYVPLLYLICILLMLCKTSNIEAFIIYISPSIFLYNSRCIFSSHSSTFLYILLIKINFFML